MFYRNTKVKVRSPYEDTNFFDIVARVFQVDMLTPYLIYNSLEYVLWTPIDLIKEMTLH